MTRVLLILPIVFVTLFFLSTATKASVLSRTQTQQKHEANKTRHNPQSSLRSMLNLYSMIECATNCNPWYLNNYGNYCGFGGSGRPINAVDRCCQQHDYCYDENARKYGCSMAIYVASYDWSCDYGYPFCHGPDTCGIWTCVCDRKFMECLNDAGCP